MSDHPQAATDTIETGTVAGGAVQDETVQEGGLFSRRNVLRVGAVGAAALGLTTVKGLVVPSLEERGLYSADGVFGAASIAVADAVYTEVLPTSPLILNPFTEPLNGDQPGAPASRRAFRPSDTSGWDVQPGPGAGQQSSLNNEKHQIWCDDARLQGSCAPTPIVYKFDVNVAPRSFSGSDVLAIDSFGKPTVSFDAAGNPVAAGTVRKLPKHAAYLFGTGLPRINAEYGKPAVVRFNNILHQNPFNLDRQDFGAPDWSFLTHLHNGHTAPESDGNPHYSMRYGPQHHGYRPNMWVDNLYLNWPAANDDREKQSFFWFHDHRMDHTGSNVYKGCVGMYPIYDPKSYAGYSGRFDAGQETEGLGLPGVRTDNADGSFDVDYDIPLAFVDYRLDDGVTLHNDIHDAEFPGTNNPRKHPEWWGQTFYKHFPNHGFTGDVFTVNGTAYPVMHVKRRSYRFRFLDASISRIYEFKLMASTQGPKAANSLGYTGNELQGQYRIPDAQQCMKWLQVASDGGLVPFAFERDSFELWPAKRREMVVDFAKYQDGTPTRDGDVIYLTNVMKMPDGRMWSNSSRFTPDPKYLVPVMKIVIDGNDTPQDDSLLDQKTRARKVGPGTKLRDLPPLPSNWSSMMNDRLVFEVQRGSGGGEIEWLINGKPFDPTKPATSLKNPNGKTPLAQQKKDSFNLWEIRNGGGGWVHPFHLHMEEHRVVMRNGKDVTTQAAATKSGHPDDVSREDLVALDPSESTIIYRGFRDFTGPYVAHCHNLAHEDHAMMFGWEIT